MTELRIAGLRVHSSRNIAADMAKPTTAVVLLHGFGAPGTDLVSLADNLRTPAGTVFFFPEGPLDLSAEMGPGYSNARAWWPIDMAKLQVAMLTGRMEAAAQGLSRGMESACDRVVTLMNEIQSRFSLSADRIVLGGFSQGAIASLEVALRDSQPWAGLLLMSATMVAPKSLAESAPRRSGMRVVLSHGRADPILPFAVAESLQLRLVAANWNVTWVPFFGWHGVASQVLDIASELLPLWLS